MKLVIHPAVEPSRLERITTVVDGEVVNAGSETEALGALADADAFFGKITPELLDVARNLRWIQCPTASLEHYVFPELVHHPSVLTNMRGIYSDVIADHVMSYILCFARNLHVYLRRQLEARWEPVGGEEARPGFQTGVGVASAIDRGTLHLAGRTLGIVGVGGIGGELARRAAASGMEVLGVDPAAMARRGDRPASEFLRELWPPDRLDEMLGLADLVCIAAPHTPRTFRLFRRDRLQKMKPTAYLINIGRGVIVDLADLTAALRAKEIAGAALDVFETEPLPPEHPLWSMENVIITPHVAGASPEVAGRHLEVLLDNIRRFQEGEELRNVADKEKWY